VVIDVAERDAGFLGDLAQADGAVAALAEQPDGGVFEESAAGGRGGASHDQPCQIKCLATMNERTFVH
jgi:hypothetical protein